MSERFAFTLFAVVVGGVLGLITVGMVAAAVMLIRRNRRADRRQLPP
jgi:MFS superfamily sulfate permease-like transporter